MRCSVLLFARYGELAGAGAVEVEVQEGATVAEIWERVREIVPALRAEERPLLACDRTYARRDQVVSPGQEIAAFPPVSGG
jgi:molybdopterin synthase sulfur carrier subunit